MSARGILTVSTPKPGWRPWRSARLGWALTAVALVAGVPPFLRMPPWCDLTLYDVAARNFLGGGTHYHDVFDTNPPGFLLAIAAVRATLRWSVEAVRAVDLLVVGVTVSLLARWARRAGATSAGIAWMAAGAALFYPFTGEFNHCQRDVWMLLPVVAVGLRRASADPAGARSVVGPLADGFLVGLAAWVKPHALFPAATVWCVTRPAPGRDSYRDFAATLAGGLIALALGVAWLVGSGAWPGFLEVFTFWNPGYFWAVLSELPGRLRSQLDYFPPWGLLQPPAMALAVWRWRTTGPNPAADRARRALSALFLAWAAQALILQRGFDYVHVPETLLMLAVLAAHGYSAGCAGCAAVVAISATVALAGQTSAGRERLEEFRARVPVLGPNATAHPLFDPNRWSHWPDCWRINLTEAETRRLRNSLAFQTESFGAIDWVQLGEVANYLACQEPPPGDGDVIAWHDGPHALYLLLDIRPAFRFLHVGTAMGIGESQYRRVRDELHTAAPRARWAVADLARVFADERPEHRGAMGEPGATPADLPPKLREWFPRLAGRFPFDQEPAFRSADGRGRYVVFRLVRPVTGECHVPFVRGVDVAE